VESEKFKEIWHNTDSVDTMYELAKKPSDLKMRFDPTRRAHYYFMWGTMLATDLIVARNTIGCVAAFCWKPADVVAMSTLEIKKADVAEGSCIVVIWRDSPVFIWHRTPKQIAHARVDDDNKELRDPQKDSERVKDPEWYVSMAVCTHLGCVPKFGLGFFNGFFCPCHGSHYDASGRVRKGPAPRNLEIPKYSFTEEGTILLGA